MPRDDGLTLLGRRTLSVLQQRGDWVSRTELATSLHYSELSTYHLMLLKRMAAKELIEIRRSRTVDYRLEYEYRVKQ